MDVTEALAYGNTLAFAPEYTDPVLYNGKEIRGHVEYGRDAAGGMVPGRTARLTVQRSDVAMPAYKDEVVIGGVAWRVHQDERRNVIVAGDEATWTVVIVAGERMRISRP